MTALNGLKIANMTIYKYPLNKGTITIHKGFRPLSVQMQGNIPVLWAEVDDNEEQVNVIVKENYTGTHYQRDSLIYIGTVQRQLSTTIIVSHFFIDLTTIP